MTALYCAPQCRSACSPCLRSFDTHPVHWRFFYHPSDPYRPFQLHRKATPASSLDHQSWTAYLDPHAHMRSDLAMMVGGHQEATGPLLSYNPAAQSCICYRCEGQGYCRCLATSGRWSIMSRHIYVPSIPQYLARRVCVLRHITCQ